MLKAERQRIILGEVELHNKVLLADLVDRLDVSMDTVRRDVKELDAAQKLRKVHGGAVSLGYTPVSGENPKVYALAEKREIANKAIRLLREDSVVFIDGGTTCLELARALPEKIQLTCFTHSLPVAMALSVKPRIKVVFIGGTLSPDAQIALGPDTVRQFGGIEFDLGFIGTGYVDRERGLTEFDWEIVQVKKAIINACRHTVLLSISEKLDSRHRYTSASLREIDTMITELPATAVTLKPYSREKLQLL